MSKRISKKRIYICQLLYEAFPQLKENGGIITLKELNDWWEKYKNTPDRRVGYPQWLISEKQYRGPKRGQYIVPTPQEEEIEINKWKIKTTKYSMESLKSAIKSKDRDIIDHNEQDNEQEFITDELDPEIFNEFTSLLKEEGLM